MVVAATVAFVPALVLVLWSIGWYANLGPRTYQVPLAGEWHGTIWTTEPGSNVVEVAAMPFGLGAEAFVVAGDTLILVGDKEGGFGDVIEGTQVKIAYQLRDDVRRALCIELVTGRESGRRCRSRLTGDHALQRPEHREARAP